MGLDSTNVPFQSQFLVIKSLEFGEDLACLFFLLANNFKGNAKTKFNSYSKVTCQNTAVELPLNLLTQFPGSMLV